MQFNRYIALPKSSLFYHRLLLILRVLAFVAIGYFLWQSMISNQQVFDSLQLISISWQFENILLMLAVILLLPLNWSLEGLKWQLIAKANNLTLAEAMKGVVLGLTLDNVLPAGTGAISGRLLTLKNQQKIKVVPGILAGQVSQTAITFLFGLVGFWMVWKKESAMFHWQFTHTLVVVASLLVFILGTIFWRQKITAFLAPLKTYSVKNWALIIVYSLLRYMVFLGQFLLLALIFSPGLEIELILGCATWVFAARTFMPKISNLERLGIRALAVVFFMQLFSLPAAGLLATVICLWFINLLIPSLVGLYLLKNLRIDALFK